MSFISKHLEKVTEDGLDLAKVEGFVLYAGCSISPEQPPARLGINCFGDFVVIEPDGNRHNFKHSLDAIIFYKGLFEGAE